MRQIFLGVALAGLLVSACSSGATDTADKAEKPQAEVTLEAIAFKPADLEIAVGETVTWTNEDEGVAHTVTSGKPKKEGVPGLTEDKPGEPDGTFDAELADAGDSFEFTFKEPGTYRYFCAIHAPMTGTIVVTDASN
jgi:plastocyanin